MHEKGKKKLLIENESVVMFLCCRMIKKVMW